MSASGRLTDNTLYANISNRTVTDANGAEVPLETVKERWHSCEIGDHNMALASLAECGFCWDALDEYYEESAR